MVFRSHEADNDGWALPASWDRNDRKVPILNPYLGIEAERDASGTPKNVQGKGIYRCPSHPYKGDGKRVRRGGAIVELSSSENLISGDSVVTSYGINVKLVGEGPGPGSTGASGGSNNIFGPSAVYYWEHGNTKIDKVRNGERAIYIMDHAWYLVATWTQTTDGHSDSQVGYGDQRARGRRHMVRGARGDAGNANILFCDLSVRLEPMDFAGVMDGSGRYDFDVFRQMLMGKYR